MTDIKAVLVESVARAMWSAMAPDHQEDWGDISTDEREHYLGGAKAAIAAITAALEGGKDGGLKMHDPEGQRRCGFPPDDPMDQGDSSWCIDPDMGSR